MQISQIVKKKLVSCFLFELDFITLAYNLQTKHYTKISYAIFLRLESPMSSCACPGNFEPLAFISTARGPQQKLKRTL
jgi:hypothetical protein